MARRRFRRTFAGKKGGRKFFWFRFTPFALTVRQTSTATHADILLDEADWANPQETLNTTQRGGARLERFIIDYGLSIEATKAFWHNAGGANIAMIPEFMVWKQSDQFQTVVTDTGTFTSTRNNERIIMDEIPKERTFCNADGTAANPQCFRTVMGHYETKSKVRLADGALGIAWRGLFDTGETGLNGYTDWVRPTILMSTP